jgi:hypothetical protein
VPLISTLAKGQKIKTMKQALTKLLKIASDVRQSAVPAILLLLVGGTGGLLYFFQGALALSIQIVSLPTPLWATIALVLLCCLYTYVKAGQIQAMLKATDQSSNNPPPDIEYRRQLIATWRKMVKEINRDHDLTNTPVANLLERHESYYSLKPHLSQKTIGEIACVRTVIAGSTIGSPLKFILDDIDRIEREWRLL